MKKILILAVLVCGNVLAGERVILKDSKELKVDINEKTVICSARGYGMPELKVNIAELNGWTLLDHTNIRFGGNNLPCMTAGLCKSMSNDGKFDIEDVIQNNPKQEKIVVFRELTETRTVVEESVGKKVCQSYITENLHTVIRGISFDHSRNSMLNSLPESACVF